ncbi:MAG: CocE/NonD family hydrolase [Opitutaceae bacterium]|jgi:putative CocE/NonD family hydrolase
MTHDHPARGCRAFLTLAAAAALSAAGRAEGPYAVEFENNVAVPMRDGATLRADVYRPKADGRFPVLLERTPYDKYSNIHDGLAAAARGYVFIIQDVRGRNASEGEWYPFRHEGRDSYDSVEWAAALPYSNGKVGMIGGSYVGVPQLLGAIEEPPHLAAIYPGVTASNYHSHWAYQGGAFSQLLAQAWSSALSINEISRRAGKTALPSYWGMRRPPADYPLLDAGTSAGLADFYFDWIAHPGYDAYWKQWCVEERYDRIKVPALHLAAWYDLFQPGTLRNYAGIREHGGSEAARQGQRLVVIPGGHAGFGRKVGEVDFGPDSVLDTWEYGLRWFDWVLKGVDNGMAREKPVRLFVMGRNVWRDEDDWPLARAKATRYYLHSAGKANSLAGDGALATAGPGAEPADTYVSDPDDPVPTHGGPVLGDTAKYPPGPLDQTAVEQRTDVLVYTTPAFQEDTEVTGPVSLELYASSSAVDTDFTGKLVDVWPNGFAQNLTEGILRARYRNSMEKAELMAPGQVYKMTIDLCSTANVFLAGHKLRLEVASSNFPRFDRNTNTGADPETSSGHAKATNAVHHDGDHPSALVLPVVP